MVATEKDVLEAVYCARLEKGRATADNVAERISAASGFVDAELKRLAEDGLVRLSSSGVELTDEGRRRFRVVMIGGGFEIIHPGHVYTVKEAKKLGDILVVVVATDKTVSKNKGREPTTPENLRVELVSSLRHVDVALLGGVGNIYDTLERVRPDIVALGYDQHHNEQEIVAEAERRGIHISTVRIGSPIPEVKTSKIVGEFR